MATYKKWSNTETDFIQNNHNVLCDEVLAQKLSQITGENITTAMVRRQRRKLALKKPRGRPSKNKLASSQESDTVANA
jgi:hypothetical protein